MSNCQLVIPHQGLGDHILCNGLYRYLAAQDGRIIIPVKSKNFHAVSLMLSDLSNITLIRISNKYEKLAVKILAFIGKNSGANLVLLGNYGRSFFLEGIRFDRNFYLQAKVPFETRWDGFFVPFDSKLEENLFIELGCSKGPYIFLHEDASRGFVINRTNISSGIRIIEPLKEGAGYSLFDYRKVLANAVEIHVIESSFAALVESLSLKNLKFAHRYARPEASKDFRSEFTYRSKWEILP